MGAVFPGDPGSSVTGRRRWRAGLPDLVREDLPRRGTTADSTRRSRFPDGATVDPSPVGDATGRETAGRPGTGQLAHGPGPACDGYGAGEPETRDGRDSGRLAVRHPRAAHHLPRLAESSGRYPVS